MGKGKGVYKAISNLSLSATQAVEQFGNQRSKENELRVAKEKELQKVQVKKEDIELIVSERLYIHRVHTICLSHFLDEWAAGEQGLRWKGAAGAERRCGGCTGGHYKQLSLPR